MKVIDMLDRIAKGEKLHFYVINNDFKKIAEYFYEKGKPLRYDDGEDVEWRISEDWLNCEVEIIEEDKKIENIGTIYFNETPTEAILHRKIEEIIDYINKEKNIDRTRRQTTNK